MHIISHTQTHARAHTYTHTKLLFMPHAVCATEAHKRTVSMQLFMGSHDCK
jgi:hypothetical protein